MMYHETFKFSYKSIVRWNIQKVNIFVDLRPLFLSLYGQMVCYLKGNYICYDHIRSSVMTSFVHLFIEFIT